MFRFAALMMALCLFFVSFAEAKDPSTGRYRSLHVGGAQLGGVVLQSDINIAPITEELGEGWAVTYTDERLRFCGDTTDCIVLDHRIDHANFVRLYSFVENEGMGIYTAYGAAELDADFLKVERFQKCKFVSGHCAQEIVGSQSLETAFRNLDFPKTVAALPADTAWKDRWNGDVDNSGFGEDAAYEVSDTMSLFQISLNNGKQAVLKGPMHKFYRWIPDSVSNDISAKVYISDIERVEEELPFDDQRKRAASAAKAACDKTLRSYNVVQCKAFTKQPVAKKLKHAEGLRYARLVALLRSVKNENASAWRGLGDGLEIVGHKRAAIWE